MPDAARHRHATLVQSAAGQIGDGLVRQRCRESLITTRGAVDMHGIPLFPEGQERRTIDLSPTFVDVIHERDHGGL